MPQSLLQMIPMNEYLSQQSSVNPGCPGLLGSGPVTGQHARTIHTLTCLELMRRTTGQHQAQSVTIVVIVWARFQAPDQTRGMIVGMRVLSLVSSSCQTPGMAYVVVCDVQCRRQHVTHCVDEDSVPVEDTSCGRNHPGTPHSRYVCTSATHGLRWSQHE